ncbi:GIDE domain-containing protein [Nitrospina watsonii]|uniref:RING-type E3 ubiquitin transferase n=1 Tax=Nitrospina watsonii TaxID=1323948 RepID=A0ABN8W355_9BACT|nr:GIDE domain-containing protein [Nitrospina watsonii]CAI2718570.1 RING-type E3 ubiquitin transferase [Nitrospina watsonii]
MPDLSKDELEIIFLSLIGAIIGLYLFYAGFRELQIKRIIQNTPTSKINTGAVGTNVEVKGRIIAEKDKIVRAPISGRPCALFNIEIQKWQRDRKSGFSRNRSLFSLGERRGWQRGRWVTIASFFSDAGFYVDDDSGANAMVLVEGATVNRSGTTQDYECSSNEFSTMDPDLYAVLDQNKRKIRSFKLKDSSWLLSNDYRFREWCFVPGEEVFVLGYADSNLKLARPKKAGVKFFLEAKKLIRKNKELQKRLDTNQDGKLDYYELERGAQAVAKKLSARYSKQKLEELAAKTKMVFRKESKHPFVLSNRHEDNLVSHMGRWATVKIWGGPIITIGAGAYFFSSFFI